MRRLTHKMIVFLYSFLALLLSSATVSSYGNLYRRGEVSHENLRKLAIANNDLALNIYHQFASESYDNFFFSPLSLSTVFGMLYYGTKGHTAQELRKALGYETAGIQEMSVHQTFQHYLTKFLRSQDPSAYILNSANAIFIDKHLDLVPSYMRDVQNLYQGIAQDVDFRTQAQMLTEEINTWVKRETNGKIDHLIDQLDPSSFLVLLNAVYFKGTWETQFDSRETAPETFYNGGLESESKKVPMMKLFTYFPLAYDSDLQAHVLEMPYKGENISMIVLVPYNRDGLESLEKRLTLEKLSNIRLDLLKIPITLVIPKFKIQSSKEMSSNFDSLGAKSIFAPGANFSGITSNPNVFVSQVLHKAVIEVNERGSEAAAASAAILGRNRFTLMVDHPFLFFIIDNRNDMILFLGRVTNL